MLAGIREILHNDDICAPFFEQYCIQFENILHCVTLQTSLYDVESCIVLCDLAEEYLASLVLNDPTVKRHVFLQKNGAIDWNFWLMVIQRMLAGENVNTTIRAFAFLFNTWEYIPISSNSGVAKGVLDGNRSTFNAKPMFDFFDDQEGLRWNCAAWLLSPQVWKNYFCHWSPLVRSYYHRLVCWRVASVGTESGLLSSVLFSNYNDDARDLLIKCLERSYSKFQKLNTSLGNISTVACEPVSNRRFVIAFNPASFHSHPSMTLTAEGALIQTEQPVVRLKPSSATTSRRIDPFEVFDDIAYSFPTVATSSDYLPREPAQPGIAPAKTLFRSSKSSSTIESLGNLIKKKWSGLRSGGSSGTLKSKMSHSSLRSKFSNSSSLDSVPEYAPSLTSASTVSSSIVRTPASSLSMSDIPSPDSLALNSDMQLRPNNSQGSSSSLTMRLIPPPPQILRKRPMITRPLFRFNLECMKISGVNEQIFSAKAKHSKNANGLVAHPCLPFTAQANSSFSLNCSFSDSEESDTMTLKAGSRRLPARKRQATADDSKYWKYAGRSINEWNLIVKEFEDFVIKQQNEMGLIRLEDLPIPFLIAEVSIMKVHSDYNTPVA